jgi:hypothetical protein
VVYGQRGYSYMQLQFDRLTNPLDAHRRPGMGLPIPFVRREAFHRVSRAMILLE